MAGFAEVRFKGTRKLYFAYAGLDLRPGGNLTLSGIQLGKEKLTATHPWLGEIRIDRRIMSSISKGK